MKNLRIMMVCLLVVWVVAIIYPVFAQEPPIPFECGDIIEGVITQPNMIKQYSRDFVAGDIMNLTIEPVGTVPGLEFHITDINGNLIDGWGALNTQFKNYPVTVPITGTTLLKVFGGVDTYTIFIGCTLRDGRVILPGENLPPDLPTPTPVPPAFGFSGVPPVDFADGISSSLQIGQAAKTLIGSDVIYYTYDTVANSTATLTVSRESGDISIGIAVISQATNELIFLGGMPSSNKLSVELTFPLDGTYAIGLFRMDTPTRTRTSGEIQVMLQ